MVSRVRSFVDRPWTIPAGLFLAAFVPRILTLGTFINIDAAAWWIVRTKGFMAALVDGNFSGLIQAFHPGVTLMWLMSAAEMFMRWTHAYTWFRDPAVGYVAILTWPIALATALVIPAAYLLLKRVFDRRLALTAAAVLALDPLYLGYSRHIHLDALFTGLSFLTVLLVWLAWHTPKQQWPILAGVAAGLTMLTRYNGIVIVIAAAGMAMLLHRRSRWESVRRLAVIGAAAMLTVAVLWPATWADPVGVIGSIRNGVTVGLAEHEVPTPALVSPTSQLLLYPLFLLTRTSILIPMAALIGLIWLAGRGRHTDERRPYAFLLAVAALFALSLMLAGKKIDRYILPVLPVMIVMAARGWWFVYDRLRQSWRRWATGAVLAMVAVQLFIVWRQAPYYQLYLNQVGRWLRQTRLGVVPSLTPGWGEGLYEATQYVRSVSDPLPATASWYPGIVCLYANRSDGEAYPYGDVPRRDCPSNLVRLEHAAEGEYVIISRELRQRRLYPQLTKDIDRLGWQPVHTVVLNGETVIWIYHNTGGLRSFYPLL